MANEIERGALYVVATPIGNLSDLSPRAVKVLSSVSFIAAEDTRVTGKLLSLFGIKTPMLSYYEHNKRERGEQIVARLKNGESAALVTDAGTPAISDPGEDLVRLCAREGIRTLSIPGPCAAVCALSVSGLFTGRFTFEGFLTGSKSERQEHLRRVSREERTMIFYEAPHKLKKTLEDMLAAWGDRYLAIAREITKINESVSRGMLSEAVAHYKKTVPKGEFVLVIEGYSPARQAEDAFWAEMTVAEHVAFYRKQGREKMDAIKAAAKDRELPKSEVYREIIKTIDI